MQKARSAGWRQGKGSLTELAIMSVEAEGAVRAAAAMEGLLIENMKGWPKVSIIVLNWNTYELTSECLESLQEITYPNYEVILVDNASGDGSGQRLAQEFPQAMFIQNEANLGFSRGCNVGIRRALTHESDYVLLLNSDSVVEKDFLEPAVELAERDDRIGLVSGKIYLKDKPGYVWYAGGNVTPLRGVVVYGWLQKDMGSFDEPRSVGFSTGAMMLIKRSVLENVGLLPEEYFFGTEEWDYSLTVRRAGYKLYYAPQSVIHHKADGSHRNLSAKYLYCSYRCTLIFHEKFLPAPIFHILKFARIVYHKYFAEWRLAHLDKATHQAVSYAFRAALRDHGRVKTRIVAEEDLEAFQAEFDRINA